MTSKKALIRAERAVETYDEKGLRANRKRRGTGTKYGDAFPNQLREHLKEHTAGMTMDEVAAFFHTAPRTITNWMNRYPEFKKAMIDCRAAVDEEVVKSLFDRATGFTCTETKVVTDSEGRVIKTETTTKTLAPDVAAQQFWLTNRQSTYWRNVKNQVHSGPNDGPIKLENAEGLSDEQLLAIISGQPDGSGE